MFYNQIDRLGPPLQKMSPFCRGVTRPSHLKTFIEIDLNLLQMVR
jgi:hypothetical protein